MHFCLARPVLLTGNSSIKTSRVLFRGMFISVKTLVASGGGGLVMLYRDVFKLYSFAWIQIQWEKKKNLITAK